MAEGMLTIEGVTKRFGVTEVLRGLDLDVAEGEFVTLLGPSGSGKTTLLKMIVGFESPSQGHIYLRGKDLVGQAPAERDVGMVFQQYALFPHMTVSDNVGYGLKLRKWPKDDRDRRVREMLDLIRLPHCHDRYPSELSGGQQQRVALARALSYEPKLLLMDEPLGALDRLLRIEMEEEIRRIHRNLGTTIIYVTHDQQEALALSDRIAIMHGGLIVTVGSPEDLYYRPANSFVASFFSGSNLLPATFIETTSGGWAKVRCAGSEVVCPASPALSESVMLAVRRRSLSSHDGPETLRLGGTVREAILLGDDRQITLEVPGVGPVVAEIDAHDSIGILPGTELELFVALKDTFLVASVEEGGTVEMEQTTEMMPHVSH